MDKPLESVLSDKALKIELSNKNFMSFELGKTEASVDARYFQMFGNGDDYEFLTL